MIGILCSLSTSTVLTYYNYSLSQLLYVYNSTMSYPLYRGSDLSGILWPYNLLVQYARLNISLNAAINSAASTKWHQHIFETKFKSTNSFGNKGYLNECLWDLFFTTLSSESMFLYDVYKENQCSYIPAMV